MRRIMTCLTTLLAVSLPATLHAQATCTDRSKVIEKLETGYGESFAGGGLQGSKRVFEVWFSEEKGTWTILLTRADGTSCIMASGTNWLEADPSMKTPAGIPG